ncbi:MAG TPA: hypothetical protein VGL44_05270 [Gaiellales bacterium]
MVLVSALLALLVFVAPSYAALAAPALTGPAQNATANGLPEFTWSAVSGADHYVFQLGGSTGFNPSQYATSTRNTRLALPTRIVNGTYTWRVAAVTAAGLQGAWSAMRTFTENWTDIATPQSPADGATLTYPEPLLLDWTPVTGAQEYQLSVSNGDPAQNATNILTGYPITTAASAYSIPTRLSDGQYWWQVTPIDAEGDLGTPSAWFSFTWSWPNATTLTLNDLDPSSQVFDPQFSWTPIAGAAYYKVDVNNDPNFPSGSNICCSGYTVATSLAPTTLLPAAQNYYWRVTPYDASLKAGVPTIYQDNGGDPETFTTTYDAGLGAVTNLSMRDDQDDPITWTPSGVDTNDPIVSWDPVPGAASYEVEVAGFSGSACDWSSKVWDVTTVSTSWTPLGANHGSANPWPNPQSVSTDSSPLTPGASYCVRVRAQRNTDTANHVVSGTPIDVGDDTHPSFNFTGYPTGGSCSSCTTGYLGAADYELPQTGQSSSGMPLFTWKPIAGDQSYYVVIATDASFQNVIDYAFTQTPAYAPRTGSGVTDYPDGTYYWAVLPATGADGTGVVARPDFAPAETFKKQSAAPTLTAPSDNASISTWPVFQWTPVDGAFFYHVQVATDANFSNVIDDTTVDETSYTAASTYPAGQKLYWRVQAEAKGPSQPVGLAWSAPGHFTKTLPVPSFTTPSLFTNAATSDALPTWQWNAVAGAVSYDVQFICAAGVFGCNNQNGLDTTALALAHLPTTKQLSWQVRAEFPTVQSGSPSGTVAGPWTAQVNYQHTIAAPTGLTAVDGGLHNLSMSWSAKPGAKTYDFEISSSQALSANGSFVSTVENISPTDATTVDPDMMQGNWSNGGTFYWHVAAYDADGQLGAFSPIQTVSLPVKLSMSTTAGGMFPKQTTTFTVTVTSGATGKGMSGVTVKATGAGIKAVSHTSNSAGKVTFKVKPTKKGNITLAATKTSCQGTTITVSVL